MIFERGFQWRDQVVRQRCSQREWQAPRHGWLAAQRNPRPVVRPAAGEHHQQQMPRCSITPDRASPTPSSRCAAPDLRSVTTAMRRPSHGPWLPEQGERGRRAWARVQGIGHARHPLQENLQENRPLSLARTAITGHRLAAQKPVPAVLFGYKASSANGSRKSRFKGFGSTRSQVRILSPRLNSQGLAKGSGRDLGRDSLSAPCQLVSPPPDGRGSLPGAIRLDAPRMPGRQGGSRIEVLILQRLRLCRLA